MENMNLNRCTNIYLAIIIYNVNTIYSLMYINNILAYKTILNEEPEPELLCKSVAFFFFFIK